MSTFNQSWDGLAAPLPLTGTEAVSPNWYAVQTRARHEKTVVQRLREVGVMTFLPLITEIHRWSDREKSVELPLFGGYVFVRMAPTSEDRLRVLKIDSVLSFVGIRGQGTSIPEQQINAVRTLIEEELPWSTHPFLKIGQRVRIRSGALSGMEGILVARNGDRTLVLSVDAIQRSLAVRIEGYDVEPL
jgi:transcription antitermination factor NusG